VSNLRNTLIRAYSTDLKRLHGCVVVAEINMRRVEWCGQSLPGAVLIDSADALGKIADAITKTVSFLIVIRTTDEVLWLPVRAELSAGDYWAIEMVPWVEVCRASLLSDDEVIRRAHTNGE
jgi:hypothetical protein